MGVIGIGKKLSFGVCGCVYLISIVLVSLLALKEGKYISSTFTCAGSCINSIPM